MRVPTPALTWAPVPPRGCAPHGSTPKQRGRGAAGALLPAHQGLSPAILVPFTDMSIKGVT